MQNQKDELTEELNKNNAPEIPINMIGKFIKRVDEVGCTFLRIDDINSHADIDDPEMSFIRFCGFGFSKNCHGHIFITNREIICKYVNVTPNSYYDKNNNAIVEISEETFYKMLNSYMNKVKNPINWKDEF